MLIEGKDYDLYTNDSLQGLGVVLMQKGKMIVYGSWQLKKYEIRYLTYDVELIVVVFVLKI